MPSGPCVVHCPADDGPGVGPLLMVAGLFFMALAVVSWLVSNWLLVVAAAAVCAVVCAAAVVALRWSRRATIPRWSNAYQPRPVRAPVRAALPAPPLMLEQAQPRVYVITDARERISETAQLARETALPERRVTPRERMSR